MTAQIITIKLASDATVVLGPTSTGIVHLATGLYSYTWAIPADTAAGDYAVIWDATDPDSDPVQSAEIVSVTAGGNLYATVDELRDSQKVTDSIDDNLLLRAVTAASRAIDNTTGRRFWLDSVASARVLNPRWRIVCEDDGELLLTDDIGSEDDLLVETGSGGVYATFTGWETDPDSALIRGWAVTGLRRTDGVSWWTAAGSRVRITAHWGWPSVPEAVHEATLIQANRLFKRKDSPEGVMGTAEWGVIRLSRVDPDVQALIQHLIIPGIG
ncbi:MAG TPA: hypothetical protein VHA75_15850 [Rugosimonospora sp.]|nr:hypothetical protein [Rugosimonospora sp.]